MQIELLVLNLLYELDVNLTMSNCPFWCKCHFILQENVNCVDFNKKDISTKSLFQAGSGALALPGGSETVPRV